MNPVLRARNHTLIARYLTTNKSNSTKGLQFDTHVVSRELQALITGPSNFLEILDEAQQRFYPKYAAVRAARAANQKALREEFAKTGSVEYRHDTSWIRNGDWKAAPIPEILQNRPVELTGPANDAAMVINAFNTGAVARKVVPTADPKKPLVKYMPDGEDSSVPHLEKELQGILNVKRGVEGTLTHEKKGADGVTKTYSLGEELAYPIYRVPGLHFDEAAFTDRYGRPVPNHLLMLLLYQYHIAPGMLRKGWVPSLYQPKLQSYEEAVLVNDVIAFSEKAFHLPEKKTRVTCLIETLSGALQAEEIVFGLKDYICALNAGRWDYIFQWIQVLQGNITPDRAKITMQAKHMEAYLDHIRDVCERRGIVFMGGMSAIIPPAGQLSHEVLTKIAADKKHEQLHGAKGAWVAHPGMVEEVLRLFTLRKDEVLPCPRRSVAAKELVTLEPALQHVSARTEHGILANIDVGVQYLASWITGRGAVALHNLMEDMATAEISRAQLWQWLHHQVTFTRNDGSIATLTPAMFDAIFNQVVTRLQTQNQVPYATDKIVTAATLFREMIQSATLDSFIADRAYAHLNTNQTKPAPLRDTFTPIHFDAHEMRELLPGTRDQGESLIQQRTQYFRELFASPTVDGHPRQFWFAGTSNPLVGAATVLGGGGHVGSYLGGWDANAVNNSLHKRLPDTLNVWVNDASNGAKAINNHLRRDMEIDNLDYHESLKTLKHNNQHNQHDNINKLHYNHKALRVPFAWLSVPQLVDLEQGWRSIHHTRLAVDAAIDQGINFMHIEDQGYQKRCGHLGDKELAPFDSYQQILRAANLTATLRLGADIQGKGKGVIFVARTDALSAKRIEYSSKLSDPTHPDHAFVDFDRGLTEDGKYYYLKQGNHPVTGRAYGLELAITRMAQVVKDGLAEYVWMETPNADLHVAKSFIDGVNAILHPTNKHAKMLYNHSPSFDWDLGFVKAAASLGNGLIEHVKTQIAPSFVATLQAQGMIHTDQYASAISSLRDYVKQHGDPLQRDFDFSDSTFAAILYPALDIAKSSHSNDLMNNDKQLKEILTALKATFPGTATAFAIETLSASMMTKNHETTNRNAVYRAIADARLGLFGRASASVGVELPLTTLPDFHYEAFAAHKLVMGLVDSSMQAYVHQVQRPERAHFEAQKGTTQPYPFYKHQESTGTGVDARFGKVLGSNDIKALEESTESDDLRDREALEKVNGK